MSAEHRRNQRKRAHQAIAVNDAISGEQIGHVGNLSVDGMLLISSRKLREDALFQFQFTLPGGSASRLRAIEVGVHEQWCEQANVPGQFWTGFRIIDIGVEDYKALCDWIAAPGGQFG